MTKVKFPYSIRSAALASAFAMFGLTACGGGGDGGGGGGDTPIPLDDPNGVMAALDGKITSSSGSVSLQNGDPDPQTGDGQTPKLTAGIMATAEPGETVSLPVSIGGAPELLALFAKVPGASSYFQVDLGGGGGKAGAKVAGRSGKQGGGSFVFTTIVGFTVPLPTNLETGGTLCFDFSAEDADGNVSSTDQSCIEVVAERPAPSDDQPSAEQTPTALQGDWNSPCSDISEDSNGDGTISSDEQESVREVISFTGSNQYATFFDFYPNRSCEGTAERALAPGGTYSVGANAGPDSQGNYARPIDFVPDPNDPNFGSLAAPCYNLIRLEGSGGSFSQFFLGFPLPFTLTSSEPAQPGDCRTTDTRPTAVITSLPFTR